MNAPIRSHEPLTLDLYNPTVTPAHAYVLAYQIKTNAAQFNRIDTAQFRSVVSTLQKAGWLTADEAKGSLSVWQAAIDAKLVRSRIAETRFAPPRLRKSIVPLRVRD